MGSIHQIWNTMNYVSDKDLKKLMTDLKMVYAASDEVAALANMTLMSVSL